MAAVICLRRTINAAEYLPVLLGTPAKGEAPVAENGSFASSGRERFLALWNRRWNDVTTKLDAEVASLEDTLCYPWPALTCAPAAAGKIQGATGRRKYCDRSRMAPCVPGMWL